MSSLQKGLWPRQLDLTGSQKRAVRHPFDANSMLVINAGPGTGKTLTLVKRIAHAIEQGTLKPHEILVLSMANRSVNSLRGQLQEQLNTETAAGVEIRTFHSFSRSLVDTYGEKYYADFRPRKLMDDLSWRNFSTIFSGKMISLNGAKISGDVSAKTLERIIFGIKNNEFQLSEACTKFGVSESYIRGLIEFLDRQGMVRYSDFITDALNLAELSSQNAADKSRLIPQLAQFKAVFVDEFQDMYAQLLNVIRCVVHYPSYDNSPGSTRHLTISGDPNQSIYQFLGSHPSLIDNFKSEMRNTSITEIHLEEAFRSPPEILRAAVQVGLKEEKKFHAIRPSGYPPIAQYHSSFSSEYKFIASEITRLILESGGLLKPSDFIVLTRTNSEIEEISYRFWNEYGLKCNKFTSSAPWIKTNIHIFLNVLNIVNNDSNTDFSLLQTMLILDKNVGRRSRASKLFNSYSKAHEIDKSQTLERFLNFFIRGESERNSQPQVKEVAKIYNKEKHGHTIESFHSFISSIENARQNLKSNQTPNLILEELYAVSARSGLLDYLNYGDISKFPSPNKNIEDKQRMFENNLNSFSESLHNSYESYLKQFDTTETFLSYFLKNYNEEMSTIDNYMVNISTVHSAKGLESPIVFLVNNAQHYSTASNWNSLLEKSEHSDREKDRLFYVACTRATCLLYLSTSLTPNKMSSAAISNFTTKLPVLGAPLRTNTTLLEDLSSTLCRTIPINSKIKQGGELFRDLKSSGFPCIPFTPSVSSRSYSTRHSGKLLIKFIRTLI